MSNYTKTTDFEAKDSLPTGDSGKIIRGSEFETEFDAISTAIATKADTAGPTFTGTLTFDTISDGTIGVTAFVDEDDMVSDSATLVPTQQSVKAYVDAVTTELNAQDLDFQGDTGGALSIDLDSESLTVAGGTGIDTAGLGNTLTVNIDSTVATLTGTQTLTNKTLTAPVISGNLTTDGTIDGRDVAADGTKLDGIESGATADQTAAEIRTLVDSATDSNVFTDADHTKLDGIEAGADVTDTTNVTAAGAVMDSELTNETAVKALDQGVATTDSPTFAGLTTTADVSFGDNDKAIFGAGSDLQIYHDGANNYIDGQTGSVIIQNTNDDYNVIIKSDNGSGGLADYFRAKGDTGAALMYHYGSEKLATTTTGIDVTGTVTADGLTVANTSVIAGDFDGGTAATYIRLQDDTDNFLFGSNNSLGNFLIKNETADALRLSVANNGDVSFYEDTGTTAKLFWDASTERLGIGTSSPSAPLDVVSSSGAVGAYIRGRSADNIGSLYFTSNSSASTEYGYVQGRSTDLRIQGFNNGLILQPSSGNVGIGTSSPTAFIHAEGTGVGTETYAKFSTGPAAGDQILSVKSSSARNHMALQVNAGGGAVDDLALNPDGGNVGIGTSNPTVGKLQVNDGSGAIVAITRTSGATSGNLGVIRFGNTDIDSNLANITAIQDGATNSAALTFETQSAGGATAERMRIDSSGNVKIGTGSDRYNYLTASTANLQIDGGIVFEPGSGNNVEIFNYRSTNMLFGNSGTEDMRIDSSGNLLVDTTVAAGKITIGNQNGAVSLYQIDGWHNIVTNGYVVGSRYYYGSSNIYGQVFADSTGFNLNTSTAAKPIIFGTNNTERMRIDSSGNLLVGKTSTGTGTVGAELRANGFNAFVRDGGEVFNLNRLTSDGTIIDFRKDSATVGSVRTISGDSIGIGTGDTGLRFVSATNRIHPVDMDNGLNSDALTSLGDINKRFKELHLSGSVITGGNTTNNFGSIDFKADSVRARIIGGYASGGGGYLKFHTDSTGGSDLERARIDSSGNLLVGTTTTAAGNEGMVYFNGSSLRITRDSDEPLNLDRLTTDGSLVDFKKNGTTVGSIGATNGDLAIGTGNTKLRFDDASDAIHAGGGDGSGTNAGTDLGTATYKFGDLYLSGGVYLGGTGSANHLNDYEEGTFTATLRGGSSEPATLITTTASYTKIGDTVHIRVGFENINTTGYSGTMTVQGCPFTSGSVRSQLSVGHYQTTTWNTGDIPVAQLGINSTTIILQRTTSGAVWVGNSHSAGTSRFMWITGSYKIV